eukprot:s162_g19.t1
MFVERQLQKMGAEMKVKQDETLSILKNNIKKARGERSTDFVETFSKSTVGLQDETNASLIYVVEGTSDGRKGQEMVFGGPDAAGLGGFSRVVLGSELQKERVGNSRGCKANAAPLALKSAHLQELDVFGA